MLPQFLGQLLTLGTAFGLAVTLLVLVGAGIRGSRKWVRLAGGFGGALLLVYAGFFGLGLLLARDRVLPPGEAVRFCGLDCHLHVQVSGAQPGEVIVRFSSNALRAPEFPAQLAFTLIDAQGRKYSPLNEVPDRALGPSESWSYALKFPEDAPLAGATLAVTWKPGIDYLVPGAGNPLVQRRTRLALPPS